MSIRTLLGAALLLSMGACDESARYDHVNMFKVAGDVEGDVERGMLLVPHGGVLMFEAKPVAEPGRRGFDGLERFELVGTQPDVVGVRRSIRSDAWVVNGVRPGSASIVVELDGEPVDTLTVEVTAR